MGSHKQIQFRSFKHYTVDHFEQELSKLNFPNYQNYNEINEAYNDFIQKIMRIIDKVAPIKVNKVNKVKVNKVNALKGNNTVEYDANSVLEGFKNYYSTLGENLVNMLPKAPNKSSI